MGYAEVSSAAWKVKLSHCSVVEEIKSRNFAGQDHGVAADTA